MDIISLIFAIISTVISVVSIVITFFQNQKINSSSLKSRYFEKIFDEYLIKKIPEARKYAKYNNDKLDGANHLIDTMDELKKDSLYFEYSNKEFYEKLKKRIDELGVFLTDCSNRSESNPSQQLKNLSKIEEDITSIYKLINTYSTGIK